MEKSRLRIFYLILCSLLLSGCPSSFGAGLAQGLAGSNSGMTSYQVQRLRIEQERNDQDAWRNFLEQNERIDRMFQR